MKEWRISQGLSFVKGGNTPYIYKDAESYLAEMSLAMEIEEDNMVKIYGEGFVFSSDLPLKKHNEQFSKKQIRDNLASITSTTWQGVILKERLSDKTLAKGCFFTGYPVENVPNLCHCWISCKPNVPNNPDENVFVNSIEEHIWRYVMQDL